MYLFYHNLSFTQTHGKSTNFNIKPITLEKYIFVFQGIPFLSFRFVNKSATQPE